MPKKIDENVNVENQFPDDLWLPRETVEIEDEPEEPQFEIPMYEEPDMSVDKVYFIDSFLIGMRDGVEIIKAGPYSNLAAANAAMQLYDKNGNIVYPENAPPNLEQQNRADIDYIAIMTGVKLNV